ncbi:MAG: hypothetical protein ACKV19_00670 [Verrucomicrobiales bacterium]
MNKQTPLLCPERLRHVPRQFSWIDHRLVRDRHIQGPSPSALSLYLFLCTVSDARGMSYYSDRSVGALLRLGVESIRDAREELIQAGLIAYRRPFYQVLSLDGVAASGAVGAAPVVAPIRAGGMRPVGDVLRALLANKEEGAP